MAKGKPAHVTIQQVEGHSKDTKDHKVRHPMDRQDGSNQQKTSSDHQRTDHSIILHRSVSYWRREFVSFARIEWIRFPLIQSQLLTVILLFRDILPILEYLKLLTYQ